MGDGATIQTEGLALVMPLKRRCTLRQRIDADRVTAFIAAPG